MFLKRLDLKAMDVEINAEIIYKAQLMRARIAGDPSRSEMDARRGRTSSPVEVPGRAEVWRDSPLFSFLFRPYAYLLIPGALAAMTSPLEFRIASLVLAIQDSLLLDGDGFRGDVHHSRRHPSLMSMLSPPARLLLRVVGHLGTTMLQEDPRPRRDDQGPAPRISRCHAADDQRS